MLLPPPNSFEHDTLPTTTCGFYLYWATSAPLSASASWLCRSRLGSTISRSLWRNTPSWQSAYSRGWSRLSLACRLRSWLMGFRFGRLFWELSAMSSIWVIWGGFHMCSWLIRCSCSLVVCCPAQSLLLKSNLFWLKIFSLGPSRPLCVVPILLQSPGASVRPIFLLRTCRRPDFYHDCVLLWHMRLVDSLCTLR